MSKREFNQSGTGSSYEGLFLERFHGAANHKAVLYHALYASVSALRMYEEGGPETIQCEGLEDVDLLGEEFGHTYIQLKNHAEPLTFPQVGKAFEGFAKVLQADPHAAFILASGSGYVHELLRYAERSPDAKSAPAKLREAAKKACGSVAAANSLLDRTQLETHRQRDLEVELEKGIITRFELDNGSYDVYAKSLLVWIQERSSRRMPFSVHDVDGVRQSVWEVLARGNVSEAVRNRLIEEIRFEPDSRVEDYFDGRSARSAHIAAGLDIKRPAVQSQIGSALDNTAVCVIIAASGQGKSTLAYRHLRDTQNNSSAFVLRGCESESQSGAIAEYLENRSRLGVRITVLVDNLGFRTAMWHSLAARFAGSNLSFLVTAREEDWKRYGRATSAFSWRLVRPQLDLDTARNIFVSLFENGRVHESVRSAEWAFERVHRSGLLIEFVYLVTHGRLLQERLQEQLGGLQVEDPGKVMALRLVSTADRYGCSLRLGELLKNCSFNGDPTSALNSLVGEYLDIDGDQVYGLHPVRSSHVSDLLDPFGRGDSIAAICSFMNRHDLASFVSAAFADPDNESSPAIDRLVERCLSQEEGLIDPIWKACYRAGEDLYVIECTDVLREVATCFGNAGLRLFCYMSAPYGAMDLNSLSSLYPEDKRADLNGMLERIKPRVAERRIDYKFALALLESPLAGAALQNPTQAIDIAQSALSSGIDMRYSQRLVQDLDWKSLIWRLPFQSFVDLAQVVQRVNAEVYMDWANLERDSVEGRYKLETRTLGLSRGDDTLVVRFHVDMSSGAENANNQAVKRLMSASILFPTYAYYQTETAYPLGDLALLYHDGDFKNIEKANVPKEIDIRRNRAWHDAIHRAVSADGWQEWEELHRLAEVDAVTAIRFVLSVLRSRIENGQISLLAAAEGFVAVDSWERQCRVLPEAPLNGEAEKSDSISKAACDWVAHANTSIRQGSEIALGTDEEDRLLRLLRINASAAQRRTHDYHKARADARSLAGLDAVDMRTATVERLLSELAATARYLEEGLPIAADAQRAVSEWDQWQSDRELTELFKSLFTYLGDDFGRIVFPEEILEACPGEEDEDMPIPAIVLGIRISTFREADSELRGLAELTAAAIPEFQGYLYLVSIHPNGRLLSAIRTHCAGIAAAIRDEVVTDIKMFPVELPYVGVEPLRSINPWIPDEDRLIAAAMDPLRKAGMAEAEYQEAARTLRQDIADESKLLQVLGAERLASQTEGSPLQKSLDAIRSHLPPEQAVREWTAVIERIEAAVAKVCTVPVNIFDLLADLVDPINEFFDAAYPVE